MVVLPESLFLENLPALQSTATIDAATSELLESVKSGEAILTGYPVVCSDSGQRSVIETIVEMRYPVEFDPPQIPQDITTTTVTTVATSDFPNTQPGAPTLFETRNLGVILEVEPSVSDNGAFIHLNLAPQRTELSDFDSYKQGSGTAATSIEQPRFGVSRVTLSLTLRNGERKLIGVHRLSKPEGRVEVFILQATATAINQ